MAIYNLCQALFRNASSFISLISSASIFLLTSVVKSSHLSSSVSLYLNTLLNFFFLLITSNFFLISKALLSFCDHFQTAPLLELLGRTYLYPDLLISIYHQFVIPVGLSSTYNPVSYLLLIYLSSCSSSLS